MRSATLRLEPEECRVVLDGDYVIGSDVAAEISIDAEGVAERHAQLTVN